MPSTSTVQIGFDMTKLTAQLDVIAKYAKACADELRILSYEVQPAPDPGPPKPWHMSPLLPTPPDMP